MAERVVNRIAVKMEEEINIVLKPCETDKIPLCGNDFKKYKHVKKYIAEVYDRLKHDGLTAYDASYLVANYGKQSEIILKSYATLKDKDVHVRLAKAELRYGIAFEMVQNPMDFFIRRTGRLYFDIDSIRTLMDPILQEFQTLFKWDDAKRLSYKEELEAEIKEHSNFSLERI